MKGIKWYDADLWGFGLHLLLMQLVHHEVKKMYISEKVSEVDAEIFNSYIDSNIDDIKAFTYMFCQTAKKQGGERCNKDQMDLVIHGWLIKLWPLLKIGVEKKIPFAETVDHIQVEAS